MNTAEGGQEGFTLIEVLISVALFGLIGMAGFTLVDDVVRTQLRTDGRLERLGELQRALYILELDFEQIADSGIVTKGASVSFRRLSRSGTNGTIDVRYDFSDRQLTRTFAGSTGGGAVQRLLSNVSAVRWEFYGIDGSRHDAWPPDREPALLPAAVALGVYLDEGTGGMTGEVRRVIELPREPEQ